MDKELHQRIKGDIRREHFENGGSIASWRGVSNIYTDKKKQQNKKGCRSKIEQE